MRTIHVTGKGNMKVRPDTTRLIITLEEKYKDYSETVIFSAMNDQAW